MKRTRAVNLVAKQPVKEPELPAPNGRCRGCRNPLKRVVWNTDCDLAVCKNPRCNRMQVPDHSIPLNVKRTRAEIVDICVRNGGIIEDEETQPSAIS